MFLLHINIIQKNKHSNDIKKIHFAKFDVMKLSNILKISFFRENRLSSLGLGVINTTRRGYPPEEGAHIALSE